MLFLFNAFLTIGINSFIINFTITTNFNIEVTLNYTRMKIKLLKSHKLFSVISVILVTIYIIPNFFLDSVLEGIVHEKLDSYINNTPERLYDIKYQDFKISVSDRAVRVGRVNITPTKLAMDSLMKNKLSMLISFKADSFYFDGLSFFKLILFNKIKLRELVANSPTVKMYINPQSKKYPKESGIAGNLVSNKLTDAFINKLSLNNSNFSIIRLTLKDSIYFKLSNSSLNVDGVSIQPGETNPLNRVKYKFMQFSSGALYGGFIDNYDLKANSIRMNSKSRTLVIQELSFTPKKFSLSNKQVHFAHDVYIAKADNIIFKGVNFQGNELIDGFYTDGIILSSLNLIISTDKRLPKNMNRKPLIGELIKKVSVPFNIDTLKMYNSKITYNEIVDSETAPLNVFFTNTNITATHITNEPKLLKIYPKLKIKARTKFLNSGNLSLTITVPITDNVDKMNVSGNLSSIGIEPVNKMIEGPLQARLISGKINNIGIQFTSDTKHSTGKLEFDYNDLKIKFFKDKKPNKKGVTEQNKRFINAIANGIIKADNNKDNEKFTTGVIDYERPPEIGIPGYLFRSIKSGLISTIKPGTRRKAIKEVKVEKKDTAKKAKKEVKKNNKSAKIKN